jgi:hypothetical protein
MASLESDWVARKCRFLESFSSSMVRFGKEKTGRRPYFVLVAEPRWITLSPHLRAFLPAGFGFYIRVSVQLDPVHAESYSAQKIDSSLQPLRQFLHAHGPILLELRIGISPRE